MSHLSHTSRSSPTPAAVLVALQEGAPLAVYCTFRSEVPEAMLEALASDLHDMMQVCVCGGGGHAGCRRARQV